MLLWLPGVGHCMLELKKQVPIRNRTCLPHQMAFSWMRTSFGSSSHPWWLREEAGTSLADEVGDHVPKVSVTFSQTVESSLPSLLYAVRKETSFLSQLVHFPLIVNDHPRVHGPAVVNLRCASVDYLKRNLVAVVAPFSHKAAEFPDGISCGRPPRTAVCADV